MRHWRHLEVARPATFPCALYAVLILVGGSAALGLELCLPACRENGARGRPCAMVHVIVGEGMAACGLRYAWKAVG